MILMPSFDNIVSFLSNAIVFIATLEAQPMSAVYNDM